MFHDELLEWIIYRINNQANEGKWLPIFPQLVASDYPTSMWIAVGAGEYTEWGAANYLQPQDQCAVIVYDESVFPNGPDKLLIEGIFLHDGVLNGTPKGIIALHQTFI